jgi:PAS domain S-box-containing protein
LSKPRFNPSPQMLRYGGAVIGVVLATSLRLLLDPVVKTNLPFTTYFVAVIVTAIYCGLGPALVSITLSAICAAYFFVDPRYSFALSSSPDALRLVSFCVLTAGLSVLIHAIQSARRRAEEAERAIKRSEQDLSEFFETAAVGFEWIGPDRRILRVNPAQLALLGYSRGEYIGRDAADFYADRDVAAEVWRRCLAGEAIHELELRLQCKDDSIKHVLFSSNAKLDDGRLVYVRCSSRDITGRKLAEQALRESEERFRTMADTTPVMLWLAGPDGLCTFFNSPWFEFTGRSLKQEIGYGWAESVHPDDLRRCLDTYVSSLESHTPFAMEYRLRRSDGVYRWVLDNGVPRYTKEGEFIGLAGSCVDISDRKRAEEASNFLASIDESTEDGIIGKTLDGTIVSWNASAERIYGYTADEVKGKHIGLLAPPERRDELGYVFETLSRGEAIPHLETVRRRKDGQVIDVALTISPIHDEAGRVTGASTIVRDITGSKRAEQEKNRLAAEIEAQRQLLDNVVANVPGVVWEAWGQPDEASQRIDFVSDYVEKMLGYRVEEWLSTPNFWLTIVHPDDKARAAEEAAVIFGGRKGGTSRFRWLAKDGRVLWVEAQSVVICDDAENPLGMRGVTMDITERKRAEDAQQFLAEASGLLASSLDYQTTLESVARLAVPKLADWCTVHIVEEGGKPRQLAIAHSDPAKLKAAREWQRRFPLAIDAPIGVPNVLRTGRAEFYPQIDQERLALATRNQELAEILRREGLRSCMIVPLIARNRTLGTITLVTAESGRHYDQTDLALAEDLAHRIALAVDNARLYREARDAVTAREEALTLRDELLKREHAAREEAEMANRSKDEFLATVSHELRTPLNAILGWAHMLRVSALDPTTQTRALETIERNARSQAQLIEDILDVSRIVTGKLRLDVRPVELASVVEGAIDAVRPAAAAKGIQIESILDPRAGPVSGDLNRLQQVVWNLAANAVKFTRKDGRVQVRLERVDSHIEIVVSDTGQGIASDFLPYVFDRFRQADATSTRRHGGLGLGLAIVRHLVEMHGGTVRADSLGEGTGATFTVQLPLMIVNSGQPKPGRIQPVAAGNSLPAEKPPSLEGLRVLIVDDEPDTLAMLRVMVGEFHAHVKCCSSAAEALEVLDEWKPDVLISDVEMPDEDGYQLIRKVRERDKEHGGHVPAVALTAYARSEDRMRALSAGYQMHLSKPFEPAELAVVIASVVGRNVRGSVV